MLYDTHIVFTTLSLFTAVTLYTAVFLLHKTLLTARGWGLLGGSAGRIHEEGGREYYISI
jgi:hypothetical protein